MYNIKKFPTNVYGLKYRPSIEPEHDDNVDYYPEFAEDYTFIKNASIQPAEEKLFEKFFSTYKEQCKCIVEIGVCFFYNKLELSEALQHSFTGLVIKYKRNNTWYIGVDCAARSEINHFNRHIDTIQSCSTNIPLVLKKIRGHGPTEIDLLLIDGYHSVNMSINDWQYAKYLSPHGVVILHDTSYHPGPSVLYDAIDEKLFIKEKYFDDRKDSPGMAIIRRR